MRCFGSDNDAGEMGTGSLTLPPNGMSNVSGLSSVEEIRTLGYHTCATFVDGGFSCWGANWAGQLGDGTTTSRPYP